MITAEERRAQIDRDLDASIGVFDGRLRKEQQVLADARGNGRGGSEATGVAGTNTAGQSGGQSGDKQSGDKAGSKSSDGTQSNGNSSAGGKSAGTDESGKGGGGAGGSTKGGSDVARGNGAGGGPKGGAGPAAIPTDVPDGYDDDIVARQLREAAMKEADAELRDRLWQEYRDYKKNSRN